MTSSSCSWAGKKRQQTDIERAAVLLGEYKARKAAARKDRK